MKQPCRPTALPAIGSSWTPVRYNLCAWILGCSRRVLGLLTPTLLGPYVQPFLLYFHLRDRLSPGEQVEATALASRISAPHLCHHILLSVIECPMSPATVIVNNDTTTKLYTSKGSQPTEVYMYRLSSYTPAVALPCLSSFKGSTAHWMESGLPTVVCRAFIRCPALSLTSLLAHPTAHFKWLSLPHTHTHTHHPSLLLCVLALAHPQAYVSFSILPHNVRPPLPWSHHIPTKLGPFSSS